MNFDDIIILNEIDDVILLNPKTKKWLLTDSEGKKIFNGLKGGLNLNMITKGTIYQKIDVDFFVTEVFDLLKFREEKQYVAENSNCVINITTSCNMRCLHCRYSCNLNKGIFVEFNDIKKYLIDARDCGIKKLTITGGEPLINWNLCQKTISCACDLGLKVFILTNGSLVDNEIADFLYQHNVKIQVSLDSCNPKRFKNFRGVPLCIVESGISVLLEKGLDLSLSCTLTRLTIEDIDGVIDYAIQNGIKEIHFPFLEKGGRGIQNWEALSLNDVEVINFLKKFISRYFDQGLREKITCGDIESFMDKILYPPLENHCRCGRSSSALYVDGNVYACTNVVGNEKFCMGNINEFELKKLKEMPFIKKLPTINTIVECKKCEFNWVCLTGCRDRSILFYGDEFHPDPWCQVFKWLCNVLLFKTARFDELTNARIA